jgi:NlpC/P60 family putative phage cell wall peptidase
VIGTDQIVAEARSWIGTPYLHQASAKGAGADCLGLLRGLWRALHGCEPEAIPAYTEDWAEPERREVLMAAAGRWLIEKPLSDEARGDVLLFRMRAGSIAKHLGLQSEIGTGRRFIHSYTAHGVVESSLSTPWQRRIVGRFVFPEGAN